MKRQCDMSLITEVWLCRTR